MSDHNNESPVGRANADRTNSEDVANSSAKETLAYVPTERDWELRYADFILDSVFRIARATAVERFNTLNREAYYIGQLVAQGDVDEKDAWAYLICLAEPGEEVAFNGIIDKAFRTCKADFAKHFGAGLPYDG